MSMYHNLLLEWYWLYPVCLTLIIPYIRAWQISAMSFNHWIVPFTHRSLHIRLVGNFARSSLKIRLNYPLSITRWVPEPNHVEHS